MSKVKGKWPELKSPIADFIRENMFKDCIIRPQSMSSSLDPADHTKMLSTMNLTIRGRKFSGNISINGSFKDHKKFLELMSISRKYAEKMKKEMTPKEKLNKKYIPPKEKPKNTFMKELEEL